MQARPRPVFITTEPRQPTQDDLMKNTADEIIPGLFLGNAQASTEYYSTYFGKLDSDVAIVSCIGIAKIPYFDGREAFKNLFPSLPQIDVIGKLLLESTREQIEERIKENERYENRYADERAKAAIEKNRAARKFMCEQASLLFKGELKSRVLQALAEDARPQDALTQEEIQLLQNKIIELNKRNSHFCLIPFGDDFNPNALPKEYLDHACEYIDKARNQGKRVLVHCSAGASRSPAIVIGYLMKKYHLDFDTAEKHVRNKRPIVDTRFRLRLQNYLPCLKLVDKATAIVNRFLSSPLTTSKANIWDDFQNYYRENVGNPKFITRSMLVESWANDYMGRHNGENPFVTLNQHRRTGCLSLFNPARTASMQLFYDFMAEDWKNIDSKIEITRILRDDDHHNRHGFTPEQLEHLKYNLPVALQNLMNETEQPERRTRLIPVSDSCA